MLVRVFIAVLLFGFTSVFANENKTQEFIVEVPRSKVSDGKNYLQASVEVLKQTKSLAPSSSLRYVKALKSKVLKPYHVVSGSLKDIEVLQQLKLITSATPNVNYQLFANPAPNDPYRNNQWNLRYSKFPSIWSESQDVRDQVKIFVADTWVDKNHPDLNSENMSEVVSFLSAEMQTDPIKHFHGTHVAGIISARTNNAEGITGALWNADVHPLEVCYSEGCPLSSIAEAITYAADSYPEFTGPRVLNLSLGAPAYAYVLHNAVKYAQSKNVTIVAAAGNSTYDAINFYPSAFPGVISVGALNNHMKGPLASDGTTPMSLAGFSNYGADSLTILAPGQNILSTLPATYMNLPADIRAQLPLYNDQPYGYLSGTSMAAPLVTAAVAALRARHPEITSAAIKKTLEVQQPKMQVRGRGTPVDGTYSFLNVETLFSASSKMDANYGQAFNGVKESVTIDVAKSYTRRYSGGTHLEGHVNGCDSPKNKVRIRWFVFYTYVAYAPSSFSYSIRDCNSNFSVELPLDLPEEIGLFTTTPFVMAFIDEMDSDGNTVGMNPVYFNGENDFIDLRTISRNM